MATSIISLKRIANDLRQEVIHMLLKAKSGHTGGSLGTADIFAALYFYPILKHRPKQPLWEGRDRFVLSNGHICPIQYAALARAGYFPKAWLQTLRQEGSMLQGHPNRIDTPGVEVSTGPLGQGISAAVGMALAGQLDKAKHHVFCMIGDGEMQEGMVWEALMLAGHKKLDNLTIIVDRNFLQIDGRTEEINGLDPLDDKLKAFRFNVVEIDGHDMQRVVEVLQNSKKRTGKPTFIIANTVMGKGVKFMEDDAYWHGNPPKPEQAEQALTELKAAKKNLR
jgi:transketolase